MSIPRSRELNRYVRKVGEPMSPGFRAYRVEKVARLRRCADNCDQDAVLYARRTWLDVLLFRYPDPRLSAFMRLEADKLRREANEIEHDLKVSPNDPH